MPMQLEFACSYHRLCGDRVLFPQGFHCTGMPIKVRCGSVPLSGMLMIAGLKTGCLALAI